MMNPIQRFWKLFGQYREQIRHIYAYAVINGLVNLSLPLGIQSIINFLQTGDISTSWIILVVIVLIGIAVSGLLQVLQLRIVENIQQDLFARSSFDFAYRLPKIKAIKLDQIHTPELVNRFFDTMTVQKGLPKILIDFSLATFQIIFGLILLTIYSPIFIILGVLLVAVILLVVGLTGPRGLTTSLVESKHKYQLAHWLEEIARTIGSFRLYSNTDLHLKKTDDITFEYIHARQSHFKVLLTQFKYFIGFKVLMAAGLLILGGILVFQEELNIGQFVAAEIVIILVINSVEKIMKVVDTIYDVLTALEKLGFVLDMELDNNKGTALIHQGSTGIKIEAIDLSFTYPDRQKRLLDNLNFEVQPGDKVLVEGPPGSGKTTLLKLLSGSFDILEGELNVNDIPIENYNKDQWYKDIGIYFPTNQLFMGTILENITMGRSLEDRRILEIINILDLHSFIAARPDGLNSKIDPAGRRLPRSIIQKILLARIIVGEPKLLVMEDPLHYVSETEKLRLINYIMSPERPWSVFVVADHEYWKKLSNKVIRLEN